jgi:glycosyltransferase involved in cell wall biosynthesis
MMPNERQDQPSLSVVIPCYNASATIRCCLDALENQSLPRDCYEIIVADSSADGTTEIIEKHYPNVRLLHSDSRLYYGMARNFGLDAVRAKTILFIDSDCVAEPRCLAEHVAVHRAHPEVVAVMGGIVNGNPQAFWGWAIFLIEFARFLPTGTTRAVHDIITANTSFKVQVFEQYGRFHTSPYSGEDKRFLSVLYGANAARYFAPAATVAHVNRESAKTVLRHLHWLGQGTAHVRLENPGMKQMARCLLLLSPLLAPLRTARILRRSFKAAPNLLWRLLVLWPCILFGFIAMGMGETYYTWNFLRSGWLKRTQLSSS